MDDAGCAKIHSILSSHGDAILTAAEEISTDQPEPVFHPFALDLAIKQIGIHRDHFDIHRHLGHGHKDLQERFLRYMPDDQLSALQSLAIALEFDETLFKVLVSQHVIQGIQVQDFHDLVDPDNSYVLPIDNSFRFHSKMQEALIANLQDQKNGQKKAQIIIEILVAHYAEQLVRAVKNQATNAMLGAFTRSFNILLIHAQSGLLNNEVFSSSFFALDDALPDGLLANARKSAWIRASAILTKLFPEDNEYALSARANVAYWTGQTGDARAALALFQVLLPIRQRVLGPEHPETCSTKNWITYFKR